MMGGKSSYLPEMERKERKEGEKKEEGEAAPVNSDEKAQVSDTTKDDSSAGAGQ